MEGSKQSHKWLLAALLMGGLLLQNVLWFAPSSLLPVILPSLSVSLAQGGLLISVVCLVAADVGPFSGFMAQRWGVRKSFALSMALVCAGSFGTIFAGGFASILLCRMLFGAGFGVALSLAATATVQWFPPQKRPVLNMVYAILPYIASAANFLLSIKLFSLLQGNWRATLAVPGMAGVGFLALWLLAAPKDTPTAMQSQQEPYKKLVLRTLRHRQVRLICLADTCDMWGFQFLSSFLPTFLHQHGGLTLDEASTLTAIFPVAGIAAGLFFGFLVSKTGRRKIFTWPMHLMIFTGTLLIAFGSGAVQIIGIVLAGIGNAGWAPALYTMPMEFEGSTPAMVGITFSIMLSLGYLAAFLSPIVGGYIAEWVGLKTTLALFSLFAALAAGLTFCMRETTPAGATPVAQKISSPIG